MTDAFISAVSRSTHRVVCSCQTHHTIVTQLLQSSVRLLDCPWLQQQHRGQVETCIKTLAMTGYPITLPRTHTHTLLSAVMTVSLSSAAKSRSISLPLDLEAQISSMLSTSALNSLSRNNPSYRSTSRSTRPVASTNPWDYKNIIEKLQVHAVSQRHQTQPGFLRTTESTMINNIIRQLRLIATFFNMSYVMKRQTHI